MTRREWIALLVLGVALTLLALARMNRRPEPPSVPSLWLLAGE